MEAITTTEMHTAGEPVRIVTGGYPPIPGDTILAKRRHARDHLDHLRKLLMFEPRGHRAMYGVIPVVADHPDADLAVLFMHNEGYSTMCGHATIALGRWAVDTGLVAAAEPVTKLVIQVPAGLLQVLVDVHEGKGGAARFVSVPAFVAADQVGVDVAGHGRVAVDVAFGGAFYAVAAADRFGLDVAASPTQDLIDAAWAVTTAVAAQVPLSHPGDDDLAFLYGTILTDGSDGAGPSANICVFADRQVDRSPCGSGVAARLALLRARGAIGLGHVKRFAGPTGEQFTGRAVADTTADGRAAVLVEVGGISYYTGECRFTVEEDDPLGGFLIE